MTDVDTSSYPKPAALPAQKSLLDQVGQYQDIESKGISISQQKLKQINDQFGLMNNELATLANDPTATKEIAAKKLYTFASTYGFKPEVTKHMIDELNSSPDVKSFAQNALVRGMQTQEKVNNLYGPLNLQSNGQQGQYVNASPIRGVTPNGAPFQLQNPPGTETVDNEPNLPNGQPNPSYGGKKLLGPQLPVAPPGIATQPGGRALPVTPPANNINLTGPGKSLTGVSVENAPNFNQRFSGASTGPTTSLPPGVGEAATNAGAAAGTQLANERAKAANFQREIFPLAQAIPALEKLGTKGTGPGTETINKVKSFVLSNVPGVKESDFGFGAVKDFDKAHKYLIDFVNANGNTGTNDKLAASFAGNPSVGISNAAAIDVAKSALALRRLQQSKYLAFEDSGLLADQASKFFANGEVKLDKDRSIRLSQIDPRAFGIDNMSDKSKKILLDQLNKNPREKELFDKSLELANKHGYLAVK